jgi:trk system potassium uptake protein TrkH
LIRQAQKRLLSLTPPQALILSYIGLSLAGVLLLKLPAANTGPISWMQALFTAVSASTITGLTVVDSGTQFTLFGQWILIFLMQCGGLGLMTFGILILRLSSGQMSLRQRAALRDSFNQSGGDVVQLMQLMAGFMVAMEALGTLLLALHWVPQMGWPRGLFHSFFHAVSAFNNAGFALSANSLAGELASPLVNLVIPLLFVSGGIGFAVVADLVRKRRFREYSLHTKLMLVGTLAINLTAILVLLALEHGNPETLGGLDGWDQKFWAAWFQALAPRSAGFATLDIGKLLPETAFFIMGLMFIGAGSGSTGGGIKLTTFIVLLLATRAFARQHTHAVVFKRRLDSVMVMKALAITVIALFCVMTGTFLLAITEPAAFLDLAFEAVSAATTTGLSRGITAGLSLPGQCLVMILMLIGRIGPLTLAFTLANPQGARIQYPDGQVNIG